METPSDTVPRLADASRRLAQRALVICENRVELLMVEVQEERERFFLRHFAGVGCVGLWFAGGRGADCRHCRRLLATISAGRAFDFDRALCRRRLGSLCAPDPVATRLADAFHHAGSIAKGP